MCDRGGGSILSPVASMLLGEKSQRAMPRYFIDLHDGGDFIRDAEGFDLPDAAAARQKLLRIMSRIAESFPPSPDRQDYSALVRDAKGRTIFRARLSLEIERVETS
jgi:hypothetical protein